MANMTTEPVASVGEVESLAQAYERVTGKIRQVKDADLIHITTDVPSAVTGVVGSLKEIRELRSQIQKSLPDFDLAEFDQLENYAYALLYVHTRWTFVSNPPEVLPELLQKAANLRDLMVSHVTTLSKHGLLDGSVLRDLKGPVGHKNLALDLAGMAGVLRENWANISGKTALASADLDTADKLVKDIFKAIGLKEQAPAVIAEVAMDRQRAFKLFADTYDQARRAVTYLRWNDGDMDQIAPSLYAGRGGGSKRKTGPEGEANPNAAPAQAAVAPAPAHTATPQPAAPVGHPDSSPYTA
jgi:hypothetical protein